MPQYYATLVKFSNQLTASLPNWSYDVHLIYCSKTLNPEVTISLHIQNNYLTMMPIPCAEFDKKAGKGAYDYMPLCAVEKRARIAWIRCAASQ